MRLVLAISIVVAASSAAATPSPQSRPPPAARPAAATPARATAPPPRATSRVWAEEPGGRVAFSAFGRPLPPNRTAPPASDCFIFTCAAGQPLGVADTDLALLPDGRL